jgi:DNA-binding transcriptional regulator YhcF (GntR family)
MTRNSPAIDQAESFLKKQIENGSWNPGDLLPSISSLAKTANVSPVSMWKAVHRLSESGELEVMHGQGTRIKGNQEINIVIDNTQKGWQGLRDRIHKDILCGKYTQGMMLPSLKELQSFYGVSYQTVKKALDCLTAEGILELRYRRYFIVHFIRRPTHLSIVLIGWSNPKLQMQARTPWGQDFLRFCEQQCSRMGFELRVLEYSDASGELQITDSTGKVSGDLPIDPSVIGYLVWGESPNELYREILSRLEKSKKPIAVLQEGSILNIADYIKKNSQIQLFSIATSSTAAKHVATFLLQSGHTSIAYFSPFHKSEWSRIRLSGLNEIYSRFGAPVETYALDKYSDNFSFYKFIKSPEHYFELYSEIFKQNAAPSIITKSFASYKNQFIRNVQQEVIRKYMMPLYRSALQYSNCTAWVCANDFTALGAMEFLKENQPKSKIAIVGFDDTFEAFHHGLTSYNFNIQATVQVMVSYIVNPTSLPSNRRSVAFEIEGMLVERKTTYKKQHQN